MTGESNVLDQLISRIDDDALRARLADEVKLLRGSRRFGLVFDRHLPESVRLPDHPIREGVRVTLRDELSAATWLVDRFADRKRDFAILSGDGGERHVSELVVVREFGERVYPGLRSIERIDNGLADSPCHVVINGENFHALQALRTTHRAKVDLIYIDPPYNTGNDGWIYNDRYVDQNDRAKSSKWLSFMERRLVIAKDLLKATGVIIVAIGDEEHHRLRILLDQIFGDQNFLANIAWQGSGKNDARYTAGGLDYMLAYAKDEQSLTASGRRWKEPKPGMDLAVAAAEAAWTESNGHAGKATKLFRAALRKVRGELEPSVFRYDQIDDSGQAFQATDLTSPTDRRNLKYELIHPATGKKIRTPAKGWRYSEDVMLGLVKEGRILFGEDESTMPRFKRLLSEQAERVPYPSFTQTRMPGSRHLQEILGGSRFPNPKDVDVVSRWIEIAAPNNAVVVDFFGGSGTTTEAVMRLNERDNGTRQSILVTNNEIGAAQARKLRKAGVRPGDPDWEALGVFQHVCRPRISTVVTGERPDGSIYSQGIPANVEMFDLIYLDPGMVRRGREFESVAPLMWLEGGACGPRIDDVPSDGWALTGHYGVLFDFDVLKAFVEAVTNAATAGCPPSVVFVITDSAAEYQQAVERLSSGIETVQLYEDYLSNYPINIIGGAR